MQTEVRIYRIARGELDAFAEEWARQVVPLRRRFGFEVRAAWASLEDDTFVLVVTHDGGDWETAERDYYASPERAALDPDPARRVKEARTFRARSVPLS